jgi:phosphate-selective porin OprO/OprP
LPKSNWTYWRLRDHFEGLIQADGYWYNSDVANLGVTAGASIGDGQGQRFRHAPRELVLKGKGRACELGAGLRRRATKFLDVNVQYQVRRFSFIRVGQYKQPNSFESCRARRTTISSPRR